MELYSGALHSFECKHLYQILLALRVRKVRQNTQNCLPHQSGIGTSVEVLRQRRWIPFISPNIFAVISPARLGKSQGRRLSGDVPNSHRPVFRKLATNGFWYILVRSQASLHCVHASVPSIFAHQRMCFECLVRGFCRIIGAEQERIILDRAHIHSFGNQRPLQCKSKHERRYVPQALIDWLWI